MNQLKKVISAGIICGFSFIICSFGVTNTLHVYAEEDTEYEFEEDTYTDIEDDFSEYFNFESSDEASVPSTGIYSVESGWSVDVEKSTVECTVYKQDTHAGENDTSLISCSYIDTNYSVFEYEQLRDMLTNNVVYANVNAQITASAVYTDAKDYLYILLVDDSAKEYRDIYYYVVGDYRCFCVTVKEYRTEAEELRFQGLKTPQETGQSIAEKFVWN